MAGVAGEFLDEGEDVVPAAAVEAGGVVAQLVENLVHLEGGEDGFDEHGALDGAAWDAEFALGLDEDVVPEAGFEVRLHLGQIEVGAGAAGQELLRVVEDVEAEVEEASRTSASPSTTMMWRSSRCQPRARTKRTAGLSMSL